jgi:hypothetical protein
MIAFWKKARIAMPRLQFANCSHARGLPPSDACVNSIVHSDESFGREWSLFSIAVVFTMKLSYCLAFPVILLAMATFVRAQEPEATSVPVRVPAASVSKMGPLTVTVELMGGQKITGTLTDVAELPIKAAFGSASVPLSEVAGVKMAAADDSSTTVIMKNGDSITGATDLKIVTVDTEWGTAKINGSSIISLLLLPDLKWNATMGLNGRRWSLVDSKAGTPQGTPQPVPGASTPRTGTTTVPATSTSRPTFNPN